MNQQPNDSRSMEEVVAEHLSFYEWRYGVTPKEINNGHCVDFAEEVEALALKEGLPAATVSEDALKFGEGYHTGYANEEGLPDTGWNLRALEEVYHSPLPEGITLEQLNKQVETGYHVFVECEGRFYDAECLQGTENLFQLPFYKRYMEKLTEKEGR